MCDSNDVSLSELNAAETLPSSGTSKTGSLAILLVQLP